MKYFIKFYEAVKLLKFMDHLFQGRVMQTALKNQPSQKISMLWNCVMLNLTLGIYLFFLDGKFECQKRMKQCLLTILAAFGHYLV